jgi:site-specific DNA-methyltransferase (adenine-specific)
VTINVHHGDCCAVLAGFAENSMDACVTDPPYHLTSIVKRFGSTTAAPAKSGKTGAYARAAKGFMGQTWDGGDVAFDPETWRAVYRVMKPGAHLIAFSGTRTYHRLVCAIEDAGFEIRDQLAWLYGSGFPKSHKQPDGWGSALKPALEPIVLARKPLSEKSIASNVLRWGVGALNIDGCRVGYEETADAATNPLYRVQNGYKTAVGSDAHGSSFSIKPSGGNVTANPQGRWPANVIHDGGGEVLSAFPDTTSGMMKAGTRRAAQDGPGSIVYGTYGGDAASTDTFGDSGSAARFFYSAKAGPLDRMGSEHPTVKPVDLMRWLCRLVTPPAGTILDLFAGSGTTGIAAMAEGFNAELIDLEAKHVADIERKLALLRGEGRSRFAEQDERKAARANIPAMPLFGEQAA